MLSALSSYSMRAQTGCQPPITGLSVTGLPASLMLELCKGSQFLLPAIWQTQLADGV